MQIQGYRIRQWGEDPQWESFEISNPGPGEVLVQVEACSIGLTVLNCIMEGGQIVYTGQPEELNANEEIKHKYLGYKLQCVQWL